MVFSAGHITFSDAEILSTLNENLTKTSLVVGDVYRHGYRVLVETKDEIAKKILGTSDLSINFWKLMLIASTNECKWLVIDEDAPLLHELDKFDW